MTDDRLSPIELAEFDSDQQMRNPTVKLQPLKPVGSDTIVSVSVFWMHESCERTTFYVRVKTAEGFTKEVEAHRTGSVYTNGEGLSIEAARDRALIDAATWGDFLGITPDPFVFDGEVIEPSMRFQTYTYQRERAKR